MRWIVADAFGPAVEQKKPRITFRKIDDISHADVRDVNSVQAKRGLSNESDAHRR